MITLKCWEDQKRLFYFNKKKLIGALRCLMLFVLCVGSLTSLHLLVWGGVRPPRTHLCCLLSLPSLPPSSLLSSFYQILISEDRETRHDGRTLDWLEMVPGLKLKTNERGRRKETDDLLDFTGSKGWFYTAAFCRGLLLERTGGETWFCQNKTILER